MQETKETWILSLGQEEPLENELATHPSFLAWEIPWTEKPGGLQSMGSQKSQTQLSNKHKNKVWSMNIDIKYHFPLVPAGELFKD